MDPCGSSSVEAAVALAAAGIPVKGWRPRVTLLQQVDTDTAVPVDKSMLEHLKVCGHG